MAKVYLLSCRDVGLDCDFEARGASLEEVMQRSADHGAERHDMKAFGPELYLKMHRGVKTLDEQEPPATVHRSSASPSGEQPLELTFDLLGSIHVVHAAGRLDTGTADAFDARMQQVVTAPGIRVVLDLEKVNYVSSAGLRSLLMLLKQTKALRGALVLAAVHHRVQDILDIAGFTEAFAIVPTMADALARLQQD
jgi:anti-anti-sigma factor